MVPGPPDPAPRAPAPDPQPPPGATWRPGKIRLFGHAATAARIVAAERSRAWRVGRAALFFLATLGAAAVAALVPPHVPWAILVLLAGLAAAARKLRERRTLLAFEGHCPRSETSLRESRPRRLRDPDRFPCTGCAHVLTLELDGAA